jgi:hypothetical protein
VAAKVYHEPIQKTVVCDSESDDDESSHLIEATLIGDVSSDDADMSDTVMIDGVDSDMRQSDVPMLKSNKYTCQRREYLQLNIT